MLVYANERLGEIGRVRFSGTAPGKASIISFLVEALRPLYMVPTHDRAGGRVRVGHNAGEPIAEEDDLFGTAVQLAARITDRAEPGQVLVSDVVRQLCAGKQFDFTSQGDATMKGFDEPVTLYEVLAK